MTRHVIHVGGAIIDCAGGRYTVEDAKLIARVCQQLADQAADQAEIERTSYYAAVAVDFIAAGRSAENWWRASRPAR